MLLLPPPLLVLVLLLLLLAPAAPAAPGARAQQSSRLAASPSPRPETDWFSAAGRGVFTHYLGGLQNDFGRNSQGKNSTWDQCVSEFDVEAYAADAASTSARYAFITIQQQDPAARKRLHSCLKNWMGHAPVLLHEAWRQGLPHVITISKVCAATCLEKG
eukprot:COSAG06_NODE_8011_length_2303_cov_1.640653_2_plen_160_part_00